MRELSPCEPREKVIAVAWPNFTSVDHVSPSHVTVLRCSGGCHTDHQSCVALKKKRRKVAVMLGKCQQVNGGRCGKECTSVEIEDEVECGCGCRRQSEECSVYQEWKSETCECECKDRKAKRDCLDLGQNKVWNTVKCECVCSQDIKCSHGMLNRATCQCEDRKPKSLYSSFATKRVERSDTNIIEWEYIVIIILSCLLSIFLIISISLLCMIKSLKAALKATPNGRCFSSEKEHTNNLEFVSEA